MTARLLSSLVLIPLLLLLLLAGSREWLFPVLLIVSALLLREWLGLRERPVRGLELVTLAAVVWLLQWTGYRGQAEWIVLELLMLLFGLLGVGMAGYRQGNVVSPVVGFRFMGVVYCGLPMVLADAIRTMERGGELICLLFFVIWATDTGALMAGRSLGGRKLAPNISPNKTWAGFWGGMTLGAVAGTVSVFLFSLPFSFLEGVMLGGILSLSGQVGDLLESVLKREAGVKDTGSLIPGHGGLLDRLDSLLVAIPVFYLFLRLRATGLTMGAPLFGH